MVIEIDEDEEDELAARAVVARTSVESRSLRSRMALNGEREREEREHRERARGQKRGLCVAAAFRRKVSLFSTSRCLQNCLETVERSRVGQESADSEHEPNRDEETRFGRE